MSGPVAKLEAHDDHGSMLVEVWFYEDGKEVVKDDPVRAGEILKRFQKIP